jgi:hypothetical protein
MPFGVGALGAGREVNGGCALDIPALHKDQIGALQHRSAVQKRVPGESSKGTYCHRYLLPYA